MHCHLNPRSDAVLLVRCRPHYGEADVVQRLPAPGRMRVVELVVARAHRLPTADDAGPERGRALREYRVELGGGRG